eukprot:Seg1982.4 transcript_id=Seg1982.4/GoldUCD/mRNA.D3Y31 product="Histone H2B" protein_id=Seg1982.4/GoldUCD/D3Y31
MSPKAAKRGVKPGSGVNRSNRGLSLLASRRRHQGVMMLRDSYRICIYQVLKRVYPNTAISLKAMDFMNTFLNAVLDRIAMEADRLPLRRMTVTANEIQVAVRMLFTGELAQQAVREGRNAVAKYVSTDPRLCEQGMKDDEREP